VFGHEEEKGILNATLSVEVGLVVELEEGNFN
jgi:hypothetical protein